MSGPSNKQRLPICLSSKMAARLEGDEDRCAVLESWEAGAAPARASLLAGVSLEFSSVIEGIGTTASAAPSDR